MSQGIGDGEVVEAGQGEARVRIKNKSGIYGLKRELENVCLRRDE